MKNESLYSISFNVINAKMGEGIGTKFTSKEISHEIIQRGGILRVNLGVTIKDYLECLYGIGFLEITSNGEELLYEVVARNIEDAEAIEANRSFHHQFTPKHDDILTM